MERALLYTGVPRFAAHTRDAMKRDVMIIGTGSMLGTALIILLVFPLASRRSCLSFLPVAAGISGGDARVASRVRARARADARVRHEP
jgi:predicted exporter